MSSSFFGGDHSKAHFSVSLLFRASESETNRERMARRKEQYLKLKELGFGRTRYFVFKVNDPDSKSKARKQAEAYAREWTNKSGIPLEVCEGCFL